MKTNNYILKIIIRPPPLALSCFFHSDISSQRRSRYGQLSDHFPGDALPARSFWPYPQRVLPDEELACLNKNRQGQAVQRHGKDLLFSLPQQRQGISNFTVYPSISIPLHMVMFIPIASSSKTIACPISTYYKQLCPDLSNYLAFNFSASWYV